MLQQTVERVLPLEPASVLVVTNERQREATQRQLAELAAGGSVEVVAEPVSCNTAPAVAYATALLARRDPEGAMIVLAADHHIGRPERFRELLGRALGAAEEGALVTLGIRPTRAETGYGYIEMGASISPGCNEVAAFHEKPRPETAERYLASGRFLWNSGMFVWRLAAIRAAFARHMPALAANLERVVAAPQGTALDEAVGRLFAEAEPLSIDYGVMEKHDRVTVLPAEIGWSDVGGWASLAELLDKDARGNASAGELVLVDCDDCLVQSGGRMVAVVGVRDLVVVETPDAVLVCPRGRAQDVRRVVDALAGEGREDLL